MADLNAIMANASSRGGILHPNPAVINMFLVNVAPGFDLKTPNWVTGSGNVGTNGIAAFIGSSTSADHAAHWIAHEIGHNLGLHHAAPGTANLMTNVKNSELLTNEQCSALFGTQDRNDGVASIPAGGTGFPKLIAATIAGDYDRNGIVDASDYAMWRNSLNVTGNLSADGNGNGVIDHGDLMIWKSNFGKKLATGVGAALSYPGEGAPLLGAAAGIPEPGSLVLLITALTLAAFVRQRRITANPACTAM
jgi:hypothetical protein